jgi:hypothetical protein
VTVTIDDGPSCDVGERVEAILRELIERAGEIEAMDKGSVEIHVRDRCLTVAVRKYTDIKLKRK